MKKIDAGGRTHDGRNHIDGAITYTLDLSGLSIPEWSLKAAPASVDASKRLCPFSMSPDNVDSGGGLLSWGPEVIQTNKKT
jgi:hypothetical protein